MRTALLIESNYSYLSQIKKKIDWSGLDITVFIEYNDICGLEKINSIKPDILILGKLLFNNVFDLIKAMEANNKKTVTLILEPQLQKIIPQKGIYFISREAFTTELFQNILMRELPDIQPDLPADLSQQEMPTDIEECLNSLCQPYYRNDKFYIIKAILSIDSIYLDNIGLEAEINRIFGDLLVGNFYDSGYQWYVMIKTAGQLSVISSAKMIGDGIDSLSHCLRSQGLSRMPILVSSEARKTEVSNALNELDKLESYIYFRPSAAALTVEQIRSQTKRISYDVLDAETGKLLVALLGGDLPKALSILSILYEDILYVDMDLTGLKYTQERLESILLLVCSIYNREQGPPMPNWEQYTSLQQEYHSVLDFISTHLQGIGTSRNLNNVTVQALQYTAEHYKENISMEQTAEKLHVSPSYLSHTFKKNIGFGFVEFLNQIRIFQAKSLIRSGCYNVAEVARRVGFFDPKYFSRVFKKQLLLSPSEYISQCKENLME